MRSAVSIIDSSERQTRSTGALIQEVVVETVMASRLRTAALIAVAEKAQRGQAARDRVFARHPPALHACWIGRQREAHHGDARG